MFPLHFLCLHLPPFLRLPFCARLTALLKQPAQEAVWCDGQDLAGGIERPPSFDSTLVLSLSELPFPWFLSLLKFQWHFLNSQYLYGTYIPSYTLWICTSGAWIITGPPRVSAVASTLPQNPLPGPICALLCEGLYDPLLRPELTVYYKMSRTVVLSNDSCWGKISDLLLWKTAPHYGHKSTLARLFSLVSFPTLQEAKVSTTGTHVYKTLLSLLHNSFGKRRMFSLPADSLTERP